LTFALVVGFSLGIGDKDGKKAMTKYKTETLDFLQNYPLTHYFSIKIN